MIYIINMEENINKEVSNLKGTSYLLRVPPELEKKINTYSQSVSKPGFEFNRTKFILEAIEVAIDKQVLPVKKSA